MRFTAAAVVASSVSTPTAFTLVAHRRVATPRQRLHATAKNLHEFDYLLREGGDQAVQPALSRRRMVLTKSQDARQTVLASTFPGATIVSDDAGADDDPYAAALDSQLGKIGQYQEQQKTNTFESKFKSMDLQDIVLTLILPGIVAFAAGRWAFNKVGGRVSKSADETLDSFAQTMLYHDGDFKEMELCVKDYKTKLVWMGPVKSDAMLKRYLEAYAKKKTVSPQAIASLSYVFTIFRLSEEKAANILVQLCKQMGTDKISSAGKLLFLGSRILKSPEGAAALQPIKALIMSTYRDETVAESLVETSQQLSTHPVVSNFFKSSRLVKRCSQAQHLCLHGMVPALTLSPRSCTPLILNRAIAEAAYRTAVLGAGKNQKSLSPGWEVLGLHREAATRIWEMEKKEGFLSDRETMYGGQTRKYDRHGRQLDGEGKLANKDEATESDDTKEATSNVFECGQCGFTLFVASGRESKFYGTDFKCPECGAAKTEFKARDDIDE